MVQSRGMWCTGMWMLAVPTAVLLTVCSAQYPPDSPASILDNMAALESAEHILVNIDNLTSTANPITPFTTTKASVVTDQESVLQKVFKLIEYQPDADGRRSGGAPSVESYYRKKNSVSGLDVLLEMERLLKELVQAYRQNKTQTLASRQQVKSQYMLVPPLISNNVIQAQVRATGQSDYKNASPVKQKPPISSRSPQLEDVRQSTKKKFAVYVPVHKHRRENNAPVFHQAVNALPLPEQQKASFDQAILKPPQLPKAVSTTIPQWMLLLQEVRRARGLVVDSTTATRQTAQSLFSKYIPVPTVKKLAIDRVGTTSQSEQVAAAFMETIPRAKTAMQLLDPNQPLPVGHSEYSAPLPPRPLLPRRPLQSVSLPTLLEVTPLPFTRPLTHARQSINAGLLKNQAPRWRTSMVPNRFNIVSPTKKRPLPERLQKLTWFIKNNRAMLLEFIAMKRAQLADTGTRVTARTGVANLIQTNLGGSKRRLRPQNAAAMLRDKGIAKGLRGHMGRGSGITMNRVGLLRPVPRVLALGRPAHLFDMAPARGSKIEHMRDKNRICQRSIMQVAGPKYNSRAKVIEHEFRPGEDRAAFHITKRHRLLLPACCNCCQKSVLGCE